MSTIEIGPLHEAYATDHAEALLGFTSDQTWENWTVAHLLSPRPGKWRFSRLARRDEAPIGFAVVSAPDNAAHHLHRLSVASDQRGRGVGAALMREIIADAEAAGAGLTLKTPIGNDAALRFYHRFDLQVVERGPELIRLERAPRR